MFNFLKKKKLREANELFAGGDIFKAKDKELDNILKKIASKPVSSETTRHREIIRALIILTIKGERYQKDANRHNTFLSFVIIILSVIALMLTIKQTNYAAIQSTPEQIKQWKYQQNALETCKNSPDLENSGLYDMTIGKSAPCSQVLKLLKN